MKQKENSCTVDRVSVSVLFSGQTGIKIFTGNSQKNAGWAVQNILDKPAYSHLPFHSHSATLNAYI